MAIETVSQAAAGSARAAAAGLPERSLVARIGKQLASGFSLSIDLSLPPGVTILFGISGAGKSTLLQCVAGLMTPDSGYIKIGSRVVYDSARSVSTPVQSRRVGYLFQDLALFPHLTARKNVEYGLAKLPKAVRRERANELLQSFGVGHLLGRKPGEISGGEQQRVALARALVTEPELLLLDEPLSALDAANKARLMDDLRAWNAAHGIVILHVTHSREEAFGLGERVVILDQGKVLAQGTPQQVLDAPSHETIAQLAGFENIFDAVVAAVRPASGTMTCHLKGSELELEVPMTRQAAGTPVRIALRAGDIMLARERPTGLSARNIFPGSLVSVRQQGVTVIAHVDVGVEVEVHLTPGACDQLRLEAGQTVWLVIKTYSCHVVQ